MRPRLKRLKMRKGELTMGFNNRRELVFLYTVVDANPNGDPLNENHPRYDEDTMQALVSDVRIKRTVRDEWVARGLNVFVDGEPKTLKTRFEELKKLTGVDKGEDVMARCIDTRLFGVTFALGNESFSWTGPVQFKWGRSLHACTFQFVQGTSAFATEGRGGADKQQRSFRNEYKVPFALIACYGIANQNAAATTGAGDEDLEQLVGALWSGTDNLITRSKQEHKARLLLEVTYRAGFNGKIGGLDEKLRLLSATGGELDKDAQQSLRRLDQVVLDIGQLLDAIAEKQEQVERIRLYWDTALALQGIDRLKAMPAVQIEMR